MGEYDFSSEHEPYPFVERAVARKIVHPKYNFFTYEYDLAMVRLDSPVQYSPHIVPICLPGSDDLLIGENATVTGWGRLSEGGTLPSVLQEVTRNKNNVILINYNSVMYSVRFPFFVGYVSLLLVIITVMIILLLPDKAFTKLSCFEEHNIINYS